LSEQDHGWKTGEANHGIHGRMLADGRRGMSVADVAPVVLAPLGATPWTDPHGRILVSASSVTTVSSLGEKRIVDRLDVT
jgi:hypothetical protein